jgi:hypothetical protein
VKLFEMKDYNLCVTDETWGLLPFKAILKRDKNRNKETAFKEMLFIYFYADIRSDYLYIVDNNIKKQEIIKDIGLPNNWKIDNVIETAIEFYNKHSLTPIGKLYKSSLKAADDISKYLEMTDKLLAERTDKGSVVTPLSTITASLKAVPIIMKDLKAANKELITEQKELEGRTKGSKTLNPYEDGLQFE